MARIADGTFQNWQDSNTIHATDYVKEREMLRTAVNDNNDRISIVENAQSGVLTGIRSVTTFPTSPTPKSGDMVYKSDEDLVYMFTSSGTWSPQEPKKLVDAHIVDKNNPHGVTANQVGAYSKNEADGRFLGVAGAVRMEIVSALFFTNGGSATSDTKNITFAKPFTKTPSIFPGDFTSVPFSDTMYHPYIYSPSTTGFSCKLVSTGALGTVGSPVNMSMNFLVIGS